MGLDSVELVMEVEKYFAISIPDREAEKAYTVGRLVDCVANIIHIPKYDFSLREKTFTSVKEHLISATNKSQDFSITDKVKDVLDINDRLLIIQIEKTLDLKFPGINTADLKNDTLISKFKTWFNFPDKIDFENISWKKYVDIILAFNLEKKVVPNNIKSKYEIYIAVMKIIVDKIGVDYLEIGLEKSFTDDLGVD